ncbi:MAG: hypothetical protein KAX78_03050 [Phycisphaerae bacterium]|nr:hypothetical protein [Phycisphaerae bacterium]
MKVLGERIDSPKIRKLRREIQHSPLTRRLLSEVGEDGKIPYHPYKKWRGAHWVLAQLAELGYPPDDESLRPLADQVLNWAVNLRPKIIEGRVRRCASQEGNALFSTITLGLADGRCSEIAQHLIEWQWADGGWNCDKKPAACHSSVHESLIPIRGLSLYADWRNSTKARAAADRGAEYFLARRMFRRLSTGEVIRPRFLKFQYPYYWHYTILFGLKVIAETHRIADGRCREALDLLEAKRLSDGGFPAQTKRYTTGPAATARCVTGNSLVRWGVTSATQMNQFVTAEVLGVLAQAGRL